MDKKREEKLIKIIKLQSEKLSISTEVSKDEYDLLLEKLEKEKIESNKLIEENKKLESDNKALIEDDNSDNLLDEISKILNP